MNKLFLYVSTLIISSLTVTQGWSSPLLVDWAFYDNGSVYAFYPPYTTDLPEYFDSSNFNWETGLGTITINYYGAGDYSFISFFDHEIVRKLNTFSNEYGAVIGTVADGQSWEIDEPGYITGDIYDNITLAGELDNTNSVPADFEDDVSMAMGWDFSLADNETALITLTLSEEIPTGFYLQQIDPDGSIYFSSSLEIQSNAAPVPEPATCLLVGTGVMCLAGFRRARSFLR